MYNHVRGLVLGIIVLSFTSALALSQSSYTLAYKLQKGKSYRYSDVMTTKVTQEMGGQEVKSNIDASMTPRLVIESVKPNGEIVYVISADSARAHIKNPMMDTTMVLTDLIGKRTRITMTPQGEVLARVTVDSVKLNRMLGQIGVKEMGRLPHLPPAAVAMGGSWKDVLPDTTDFGGGKIVTVATREYKIAGKEKKQGHDCLKVTYTGTMTVGGKGTMMGMQIFVEGTGKMTGTMYFDPDKGLLVSDQGHVESETTMAATGQQNMTIPVSQQAELTRKLLE